MKLNCVVIFLQLFMIPCLRAYSPIVIVPGTGGNWIEGKLNGKPSKPAWYCSSSTDSWFSLWLNVLSLVPFALNCWVDNIRLEWNMKSKVVTNRPGVETRVPGFGDTKTIDVLDRGGFKAYMKPLTDFLKKLGYTKGKDLLGAPYDWRYSPDSIPDNYYEKLKGLIESAYEENMRQKVTLISHSYGCVVTQYFLSVQSKEWKGKFIKQWIPLAGVFGGTMDEVMLYTSGYLQYVAEWMIDRLKLRPQQRSFTSNLWLLPSLSLWPKNNIIVTTEQRTYRISDIDELLKDAGFPEGAVMRHNISNSSTLMSKPPNVPIHCFYGVIENSTIERLEYSDNFPDHPSRIIKGKGDGTVNYDSLKLCKRFATLQDESVSVSEMEGLQHNEMLTDKNMLIAIKSLL